MSNDREKLGSWLNALRSWNLKYDAFPELMLMDCTVLIAVSTSHTDELQFSSPSNAEKALNALQNAMAERSNNYWGRG